MPRHVPPSVRAARARRRAPLWLVAGALVLGSVAWGHLNPTSSLLVHELLDHPVVHGLAGYLLIAWGVRSLVRDAHRRLVSTILLGAVGATVFGLVGLLISVGVRPGRDEQVVAAPLQDGVDPYEAVVTTDGDDLSPLVTIVIRHTRWSLGARWWDGGCVNGDSAGAALDSARWEGPTRLLVRLRSGAQIPVQVDPRDARPLEPPRLGRRCGAPATSTTP